MKSLLIRLSFVIITILLVLQVVKNIRIGEAQPISTPENKDIPVKGEWIIEKYKQLDSDDNSDGLLKEWMGKRVYFSEDIAVLGDETCSPPKYKVTTLNAGSYLLNTYNTSTSELGIENKELDVVSVTSVDKHFYDFLRLNSDNMIVYADKTFFFLRRVSEAIRSSDVAEKVKNVKIDQNPAKLPDDQLYRSGVLLALRSQGAPVSGITNISRPVYRTLWIASRNKTLHPVRETAGLLVPRLNGFWKVELRRQYINSFLKESIFAYPLETNSRGASDLREEYKEKISTNILKNILFIGNDYISLEYGESQDLSNISFDRLQVVPIDKPEISEKVKISEIEGENGKNAFINSAKAHLTSNKNLKSDVLEKKPREDNFAMARRNGHWILKGRLDYLNPLEGKKFEDFTINLMPSKKLVNYDDLAVSWNAIKERMPNAIDAYTSPNKDIAIVVCRNVICIYGIENATLSQKPFGKVRIQDGESVIMAEWATGEYVERWERVLGQDSWLIEN